MTDDEIAERQRWLWSLNWWAGMPYPGSSVEQRQKWAVYGNPADIARDKVMTGRRSDA